MIFCPECGADRRNVPPVAACPQCGTLIGEAHEAVQAPADEQVDDAAATTAWQGAAVEPAPAGHNAAPPPDTGGPPASAAGPPAHTTTPSPQVLSATSQGAAGLAATGLPGAPAIIPVTPQPGRIVLGVLFLIAAGWLLLSYLPENKPLSEAEQAELAIRAVKEVKPSLLEKKWLRPDVYQGLYAAALLVGLLGIVFVVRGATWRAHKEVECRRCHQRVVGTKEAFGARCPLASHLAEYDRAAILGFILFLVLVLILVASST